MTLLDLTKELFTYLVLFREQAAEADPPTPERVAEDLDAIFSRMEDQAQANPALGPGYEQVRYCLAALCDEVALCGDWPGKAQWSQHTWEERLFGTREGGQRFFVFMDRLDSLPKDVLAVHYLCLTLGFCGCYAPGDPRLAQIKSQVLARLPGVAPTPSPAAACPASAPAQPAPDPHPEPPAPKAAPAVDPPPVAGEQPAPAPDAPPAEAAPRAGRKPRDLRYLAAGGLAVLAFAFTLGLGIVALHDALFGPDAGEKPAGREVDLALPEPLAPLVVLNLPRTSATSTTGASSATTASTAAPSRTTASTTVTSATTTATAATTVTSATTATTQPPAPAPPPAPVRAAQPAPAPAQAAAEAEPETYSLHAGLFVGPIQSGRLAEQLAAAGFAAWVREERRDDGQVRYRVYVGPFADKNQAQEVLAAITAKFGIKPFVVTSPAP